MVAVYWHVSQVIVEEWQHGRQRAGFDQRLLEALADGLQAEGRHECATRRAGASDHAGNARSGGEEDAEGVLALAGGERTRRTCSSSAEPSTSRRHGGT
jgi:hypothetical protein